MPRLSALNSAALGELNKSQVLTFAFDIDADATAGLSFPLPFEMEIITVFARSTAASSSATVTVGDGTNDITDGIAIATVDSNTSSSTIDTTYATTDVIQCTTNNSAARCRVFVVGVRTQ